MTYSNPVTRLAARPFLKWVGGKRSILPSLVERVPKRYGDYYEPFIGGGALFFDLRPTIAFLSDINSYLILTYQAVRDDVEQVIHHLRIHSKQHTKAYYLEARIALAKESSRAKLAALFIYLNRTCYNGLYRTNQKGIFNVPMGDYEKPSILNESSLHAASQVLQGIKIQQQDFTQIRLAKEAFYYLDPPYHKTYDKYDRNGFSIEKHEKLAELCHAIDKKGGYFMLSNSDTDFVRKLYGHYLIENIMASRSVSCRSNQRGRKNEVIIRNYKS